MKLTEYTDAEKFFRAGAKGECPHERVTDISGYGCTNIICMQCGGHVYESENVKLRFFDRNQWDNWVNFEATKK